MVTTDEAETVTAQPTSPCCDCPFVRDAIAGWLGGDRMEDYLLVAHSDQVHLCHAQKLSVGRRVQCAGLAIFRRNVVKETLPPNMTLPADRKTIFANDMEFAAHHLKRTVTVDELRDLKFRRMQKNLRTCPKKKKK